jgi:uncharacterized protein with PhoU and TrkA domain
MSRTKLRILFLEFEYEVLCRLQAESEAVMGLIKKVLRGVGKAVDAANNAADKVHDYAKEKELDKKAEEAVHKTENFIRENEIDKKVINAGKTLENGVISVGEKLEETFNKLF